MNPDPALLIVTGATLEAEIHDRPVAYLLRQQIVPGLAERGVTGDVVVCSDVWYLNQERLRSRPTISVGAPGVNALSAFLADKLPSMFAVDDELVVLGDPEMIDLVVCCWGRDPDGTRRAAGVFAERYLREFLDAVAGAP